jgi:hypothetical protein
MAFVDLGSFGCVSIDGEIVNRNGKERIPLDSAQDCGVEKKVL